MHNFKYIFLVLYSVCHSHLFHRRVLSTDPCSSIRLSVLWHGPHAAISLKKWPQCNSMGEEDPWARCSARGQRSVCLVPVRARNRQEEPSLVPFCRTLLAGGETDELLCWPGGTNALLNVVCYSSGYITGYTERKIFAATVTEHGKMQNFFVANYAQVKLIF